MTKAATATSPGSAATAGDRGGSPAPTLSDRLVAQRERALSAPLPTTGDEVECYVLFTALYADFFRANSERRKKALAYEIDDAARHWWRVLGQRSVELKTRARYETEPEA